MDTGAKGHPPTFALKGIVFYAFLLTMLAWNEAVALHLYKLGPPG